MNKVKSLTKINAVNSIILDMYGVRGVLEISGGPLKYRGI